MASGAASPLRPILSPPRATGYTPRSSTNNLKNVVENHLEELFRV
jgi:hypothetical protein